MNRLQLVQALRSETGALSASAIATTANQSGDTQRLVYWIDQAWNEIQLAKRWRWQWENPTITIAAGQYTSEQTVPEQRYDRESAYVGSVPLTFVPWPEFRHVWPTALIVDGTPENWSVRPDNTIVVSGKPTSSFSFTVERYTNPVPMTQDNDVPALPAEYHMAIVWKAAMFYAGFDEAGGMYSVAKANYRRLMDSAAIWAMPGHYFGAPLGE